MRLALLVLIAGCADRQPPASWTTPGELPLAIDDLGGSMRFSALVQLGDAAPFEALVDTGSSGLRVLPGVVPDDAFADTTSVRVNASYHSGLALDGVLAHATVSLAGLATPEPIPVMRVDAVGCTTEHPDCDAAGRSAADYTMFGGYRAILGLGMRTTATSAAIGNPIAQLTGHPAFVVRAPGYGGTTGVIAIGAAPTGFAIMELPALADSSPLADGTPAWDDRAVPVCVLQFCAGAILDTGAPPIELLSAAFTGAETTSPTGEEITIAIGDAPFERARFVIGSPPRAGVDKVVIGPRTGTDMINLGTWIFFRDDVLFDQTAGRIGLAPHGT